MTYAMLRTKVVKIALTAAISEIKNSMEKGTFAREDAVSGKTTRILLIENLVFAADLYNEPKIAVSPEDFALFSSFYKFNLEEYNSILSPD